MGDASECLYYAKLVKGVTWILSFNPPNYPWCGFYFYPSLKKLGIWGKDIKLLAKGHIALGGARIQTQKFSF